VSARPDTCATGSRPSSRHRPPIATRSTNAARLADNDESRRADIERIEQLEEQLAQKTQVVNDLKSKLGDFVSGLEAIG
jgi:hypothetical protein